MILSCFVCGLSAGLLIPTATIKPFYPVQSPEGQIAIQELPDAPAMIETLAQGVSPIMVSRWGLEGLADLYMHDHEPGAAVRKKYSYQLLSSVAITFHKDDSADAREELLAGIGGSPPSSIESTKTFGKYTAILGVFAVVFVTAIAVALKRKESHGSRG